MMTARMHALSPTLPSPQGALSESIIDYLPSASTSLPPAITGYDPVGRDAQLALCICYELHYRGFVGVDDEREWDPTILAYRNALEASFLSYLRDVVDEGDDAVAEMDALSVEPVTGSGPSWYLRDEGSWEQMREYFAHRSVYHLKEADPHAWAIPRLTGHAKSAYAAVEFDEYGGGRGDRMHQQLWIDLMNAADLDSSYFGYLDRVPASTLTWVNLMSLFGLHRGRRGATVGHFAATEITSSPGSRRFVDGMKRLGAPQPCLAFYAEHIEADAVHEQILRHEVVGDLLRNEPHLERDVVFGMRTLAYVEEAMAAQLIGAWQKGESSLL